MRFRLHAVAAIIAAILLPFFASPAHAQTVTKFATGFATIGDGSNSSGTHNVSDYNGNPAAALRQAVGFASRVHFLKGTYVFSEPFVSGRSQLEISAEPGALFTCSGSNSVAFFDLSGTDVKLSGCTFQLSTWVNSQIAVRFRSPSANACKRAKLTDCSFSVVPSVEFLTAHAVATPMVLIHFDAVVAKWIDRCFFFPQAGVTVVKSTNGNGLKFVNSEISNGVDGGFPDLSVFADMYRGFDLAGEEWCTIAHSKFWAIGNYTLYGGVPTLEPDALVRFDGSSDTTKDEFGHFVFNDNIVENVNTSRPLYLISCQWGVISGNLIGPNFAAVGADGEAALKIVGSNATSRTLTTINSGTKTFTFTQDPALAAGEAFYVVPTGLADIRNAATYTAASPSAGAGPYTVVTSETPAANETAITGVAYVATTGNIGPKKSSGLTIAANDFHNSVGQGTAGAALWMEHTEKSAVLGNHFNLQRGLRIGYFDTTTIHDVAVLSNSFSFYETSSLNPSGVLIFPDGVSGRFGAGNNTWVGDPVFLQGADGSIGVTGNWWQPHGLQERTADGGGDTNLAPEAADTAEQLSTNQLLSG